MKTSRPRLALVTACTIASAVAGCATMSTTDAMVPLQNETAKAIGLASSDDLTITNVNAEKPNAPGGQNHTYTATTKQDRIFNCPALTPPGIGIAAPSISMPTCTAGATSDRCARVRPRSIPSQRRMRIHAGPPYRHQA